MMMSLYDELAEKLRSDSSVRARNGPRIDIGLLMFAQRDDIQDLWITADRIDRTNDPAARQALHAAIEKLRPLFGER
jgi:hypothetical protein